MLVVAGSSSLVGREAGVVHNVSEAILDAFGYMQIASRDPAISNGSCFLNARGWQR